MWCFLGALCHAAAPGGVDFVSMSVFQMSMAQGGSRARGRAAGEWQSWDPSPHGLAQGSVFFLYRAVT